MASAVGVVSMAVAMPSVASPQRSSCPSEQLSWQPSPGAKSVPSRPPQADELGGGGGSARGRGGGARAAPKSAPLPARTVVGWTVPATAGDDRACPASAPPPATATGLLARVLSGVVARPQDQRPPPLDFGPAAASPRSRDARRSADPVPRLRRDDSAAELATLGGCCAPPPLRRSKSAAELAEADAKMRYASLEEQLAPFPVFATSTCRTAFAVARAAHDGRLAQHSSTGAPALAPPVAAAVRLASLGCDEHTVGACLLFGAVEASPLTEEGLLAAFSPSAPAPRLALSAARLAAACASASSTVAGAGAATSAAADGAGGAGDDALRSLLLCAAPDVRAVLVLLSSRAEAAKDIPRLHSEAARRAAAHEALAVHAPLAARLGVWPLKTQLEEAAFAVLHPGEAASLAASLAPHGAEEEAACVDAARARLQAALSAAAVPFASVSGRAKSLCSAHRKLRRARLGVAAVAPGSADAVPDARGLRVLAPDEAACRAALAVVHSLWHPVPGRFKDYIASPKPNGYRSLHSLVRDPTTGRLLEVQVRTPAMHAAAEGGAASHWLYKASLDKRASGGGGMPAQPPPSPLSASEASFLDAQTSWARFLLSWTPAAAHGAASPPPSPDASSPSSSAAASCAARTPGCVYPLHDASSCSHASPPPPEPDASAAPLLVNVAFGRGAARVLRLPRDCTRAGFKAAAGLPPLPPLPPSPPLHGRSLPHPLAPAVDEPLSNGSRPLLAIVNGLEAGDLLSGPPHGHCGLRPGDVIELAEWRHCGTRGAGATQAAAPQRRRGRSRDFDDAGVDDALRGLLRIAVPA